MLNRLVDAILGIAILCAICLAANRVDAHRPVHQSGQGDGLGKDLELNTPGLIDPFAKKRPPLLDPWAKSKRRSQKRARR